MQQSNIAAEVKVELALKDRTIIIGKNETKAKSIDVAYSNGVRYWRKSRNERTVFTK
jgi:hypothetical protein